MRRPILTTADAANLVLLDSPQLPQLKELIARATVVPSNEVPPSVVTINSHVVYTDTASGEQHSVVLSYPGDAEVGKGRISVVDPIGMALLGASVGDQTECVLPDGTRRLLRVDEVLRQPEHDLRTNLQLNAELVRAPPLAPDQSA